MNKCNKCLKGAKLTTTGVDGGKTLKIDLGGAVIYIMPKDGDIDVHVNSDNLLDGEFAVALWRRNDCKWIITDGNRR